MQVLLVINQLTNHYDMTIIYCSKKLQTFIDTETNTYELNPSNREWNAHLVSIGGRKCLCIVDKKNTLQYHAD